MCVFICQFICACVCVRVRVRVLVCTRTPLVPVADWVRAESLVMIPLTPAGPAWSPDAPAHAWLCVGLSSDLGPLFDLGSRSWHTLVVDKHPK